ncbi:MAG TPA: hypothetical protein VFW44_09165 [Bryobacteraceae bacterium]|nr:hypothetical protein [Bryobacteraceae bacterium]
MPARRAIPQADPQAQRIDPQPLPPRIQPLLIAPTKKPASVRPATVNSAFIERIESGMRSPRPLPDIAPGTVLILESDLSIRKLLRRLLERRGYSAVEVASARDLTQDVGKHLADLLVIDVSDPADQEALNEKALLALAHEHKGLKILALSMEAPRQNDIPQRLLTLPKPFSLDRFVECVDRLLEQRR